MLSEFYSLHMQYCYNITRKVLLQYCRIARFFVAHAIMLHSCGMIAQHYNDIATTLKRCMLAEKYMCIEKYQKSI